MHDTLITRPAILKLEQIEEEVKVSVFVFSIFDYANAVDPNLGFMLISLCVSFLLFSH